MGPDAPHPSVCTRPLPNKAIKKLAARRMETSYWRVLPVCALCYLPSTVLNLITGLYLSYEWRLPISLLFNIAYYPMVMGGLSTYLGCYHGQPFTMGQLTQFYRRKTLLKQALGLGALVYLVINLPSVLSQLLLAVLPASLAYGLSTLISSVASLVSILLQCKFFLAPYLLLQNHVPNSISAAKTSLRLTKCTMWKQIGMILSFMGWILLTFVAGAIVTVIITAATPVDAMTNYVLTPYITLIFFIFVYPYYSVSMAGLASEIENPTQPESAPPLGGDASSPPNAL